MSNRILVNPGTPQSWEITLRPGVNRLGSSEDNDFTINHPSISTHHCEFLVSDAGVFLKALGSKSGTFVDGTAVQEIWLQSGQHIQLGAIDTVFEAHQTESSALPVNQPAPGATVIVAAIGSPPGTEPLSFPGASPFQREIDLETPESAARASTESAYRKKFPVHMAAESEAIRRKQFILGVAGAIMGSLVGLLVWFLLIKSTGSPLLLLAWGVGGLTGVGAFLLAKKGGLPLGVAAAICALAGIIWGECLAAKAIRSQEATKRAIAAYRSQLEVAKEAVRADSPEEIRKLLAQLNEKSPEEITDDQIKNFRDEELPRFRDFALGRPSREEFVAATENRFAEEFGFNEFFFKNDLKSGLFMVLFAALGIATAYKFGFGKDDDQPGDARG